MNKRQENFIKIYQPKSGLVQYLGTGWYPLVLECGIGYFVRLRNLESTSVLRLAGRRECRQLSLESIFLKKDLLILILRSFRDLN